MHQICTKVAWTILKRQSDRGIPVTEPSSFNEANHRSLVYAFHTPHFDYFLRRTAKFYLKMQELGHATKMSVNTAQENGFCCSARHGLHALTPLRPPRAAASAACATSDVRGPLQGAHLVLISARSRTTAITGADPSPVAGSEVWIERLPSWGSNMDWTACTTFSVMDSLWRGNAWWWGGMAKS